MAKIIDCACGARGDEGEMIEHHLSALANNSDKRTHEWRGGNVPEVVAKATAARKRREETKQKLADAAGVSISDLREIMG